MKASNGSSSPTGPRRSSPERASFRLAGPSLRLDPRIHAWRADLADIALAERIFAPHYAKPAAREVIAPLADLREQPSDDATLGSQLLHGERFALLDAADGWAWGYGLHDRYVGYVRAEALGAPGDPPTHVVAVPGCALLAEPAEGAARVGRLPIGYRFAGGPVRGYAELPGGHVAEADIRAIGDLRADPVAVAEALAGTPYLWGGRTDLGIDCSGLVQLAFALAGVQLPRDSDLQLAATGADIAEGETLQRGDIVFFPRHVGLMADEEILVHATRHWGKVTAEPLADVVARVAERHETPVLGRRRVAP